MTKSFTFVYVLHIIFFVSLNLYHKIMFCLIWVPILLYLKFYCVFISVLLYRLCGMLRLVLHMSLQTPPHYVLPKHMVSIYMVYCECFHCLFLFIYHIILTETVILSRRQNDLMQELIGEVILMQRHLTRFGSSEV